MLGTMQTWSGPSVTPTRLLPLLGAFTPLAHAQPELPGLAQSFTQMLLGLVVVIALLLTTLWLIKRLSAPRGPAAGLKVLGGVAVGSRERLVLVEVGDKVLVLGVTASSINTLHTTDSGSLKLPPVEPTAKPGHEPDFAGWLKRSLERSRGGS